MPWTPPSRPYPDSLTPENQQVNINTWQKFDLSLLTSKWAFTCTHGALVYRHHSHLQTLGNSPNTRDILTHDVAPKANFRVVGYFQGFLLGFESLQGQNRGKGLFIVVQRGGRGATQNSWLDEVPG